VLGVAVNSADNSPNRRQSVTFDIPFWMTVFSLIGPLGVAVGVCVQSVCSPVVEAIIVSLIAGSFVYVGATEVSGLYCCAPLFSCTPLNTTNYRLQILPEEFENGPTTSSSELWKRFGCVMCGVALIHGVNFVSGKLEP
jgi:hypothetical protein